MPEGDTTHRMAKDHGALFRGQQVKISSPQGRFEEGALTVSGSQFRVTTAHGKHLFYHHQAKRWSVTEYPHSPRPLRKIQTLWETSVWWLQLGVRAKRIITTLKTPPRHLGRFPRREALMIYGHKTCQRCGSSVETATVGNPKLYLCVGCQTRRE